jgi:hypothetical protein
MSALGPESYDPLPDLIERAERRPDGIQQLKQVAALALDWHAPRLTWVTDMVSKDPATGERLWSAATVCACGAGEFPCEKRREIARVLGAEEWVR